MSEFDDYPVLGSAGFDPYLYAGSSEFSPQWSGPDNRGAWEPCGDPVVDVADVEPAPISALTETDANTGAPAGTKRLTKEESNNLVKDYLEKPKIRARAAKGEVSIREVSQKTGVPISSINKTPSWRGLQDRLESEGLSKRTRRRKVQAYTNEMDAVVEDTDAELQELIKEQKSDDELSPLDKGRRSKVRTKKKF